MVQKLHTDGKNIRNEDDDIVFLRGVNRNFYSSDCTGTWQGAGEDHYGHYGAWSENNMKEHIDKLADAGFNVLRFHAVAEWWRSNMSTTLDGLPTDRQIRDCIKDTIEYANLKGIYVILEWFAIRVGWPPLGLDPVPWPPYSQTDGGEVITSRADWVNFWVEVATELKDYNNIIFELWNEPHGDTSYCNEFMLGCDEAITAIRSIPCDNLIIIHWSYCDGFWWIPWYKSGGGAGTDYFTQSNLVYSNHIYHEDSEGPGATITSGTTSYDDIKNQLLNNHEYGEAVDIYPVFIGEFACISDDDVTYTAFINLIQLMNDWSFSYTAWLWDFPIMVYTLQDNVLYPWPVNRAGQALIDGVQGGQIPNGGDPKMEKVTRASFGSQKYYDGMGKEVTSQVIDLYIHGRNNPQFADFKRYYDGFGREVSHSIMKQIKKIRNKS